MTDPSEEELNQALKDATRHLKEDEAAANVQKASKEAESKLQERAKDWQDKRGKK